MKPQSLGALRSAFTFAIQEVWKGSTVYCMMTIALATLGMLLGPLIAWLQGLLLQQLSQLERGIALLTFGIMTLAIATQALHFIYDFCTMLHSRLLVGQRARLKNRMNATLYTHMEYIDMRVFQDSDFHDTLELAYDQTNKLPGFFQQTLDLIGNLLSMALYTALLTRIAWWMPLAVLACFIPSYLLNQSHLERRMDIMKHLAPRQRYAKHLFHILSSREYVEEVKLWDTHSWFADAFTREQSDMLREQYQLRNRVLWLELASGVVNTMGSLLCLGYAIWRVSAGNLDIGVAATVFPILIGLQGNMQTIAYTYRNITTSLSDIQHLQRMLHMPQDRRTGTLSEPLHSIRLEDVSFSYKNDGHNALEHITLAVQAGECIALVGQNGSGKTTLCKLLCGLYLPSSGTIYYNGVAHTQLSAEAVRRECRLLFQDYARYSLPLHENITLEKECDMQRMQHAMEQSAMTQVLQSLPEGLDTWLLPQFHEPAADLSIGQWQRTATARAPYHRAPVLLMDEPSAALDPIAEAELYEAIFRRDTTPIRIVVSHRLSCMKAADHVLVLENGQLAEHGTPEALLSRPSRFYHMYTQQASRYEAQ